MIDFDYAETPVPDYAMLDAYALFPSLLAS
jgi:hypothetical protein